MNMTKGQGRFIESVIIKTLLEKFPELEGKLDIDMFKASAREFNDSPAEIKARQIQLMAQCVNNEDNSLEDQLEILLNHENGSDYLWQVEGLEAWAEMEYTKVSTLTELLYTDVLFDYEGDA